MKPIFCIPWILFSLATALQSADNCQYRSINGYVTLTGVDGTTYIETPIWAELVYQDGIASELLIRNFDSRNPIYFSGIGTGTNQYNAGTGRTGQEVAPGGRYRHGLAIYQSRSNPLTKLDVTWEYCGGPSARSTWGQKPPQRRASTPELEAALLAAIKIGDVNQVTRLLEAGASADATDPQYGYTALMLASRKNNLDVVKLLLGLHADLNRKSKDGYTALLFGANCGDAALALVELLLRGGADPQARQNKGFSALGIIEGGTAPQMESLLRRYGVPK